MNLEKIVYVDKIVYKGRYLAGEVTAHANKNK